MKKVAGIVLTGGKSSRFGKDKTFAFYNDTPFYQHVLHRMYDYVDHIYVVKREDQLMNIEDEKITLLTDDPLFKGDGPLAGLYTAMHESDAEWFLVLPVDTPFVELSIFSELMQYRNSEVDAIIPRTNKHIHPLIALYHKNSHVIIEEQLIKEKRSVHQLLARLNVKYVDYEEDMAYLFTNINTLDHYKRVIKDDLE